MPGKYDIAEDLEHGIRAGLFKPGDKMPSERELCGHYGVARNTVKDAYRILLEKNLVITRQGTRPVVRGGEVTYRGSERFELSTGAAVEMDVALVANRPITDAEYDLAASLFAHVRAFFESR